jgi:hypothetical protein
MLILTEMLAMLYDVGFYRSWWKRRAFITRILSRKASWIAITI